MVSGVPGVWLAVSWYGLVLGIPSLGKCCFSSGCFGDGMILEKDTLALPRSYHYYDLREE